eukprot:gene10346-11423_t
MYRKIFEHCTPIISTMQKSTLDAVMVASMLGDLKAVLTNFNFNQIWGDTLLADPAFPVIRKRGAWRNMEQQSDGTQESWKQSLINLGSHITNMFGEQLSRRFSKLARFRWMDLIHPAKFDERKKASSQDQRSLIEKLLQLYPFAVSDVTATEYNLNVLYNNNEIALLLQKLVQERDAVVARKNEKRARLLRAIQQRESNQESQDFEENDLFEPDENANIEPEAVKQGKANVQDLLSVIKKAGLEDALPQALTLLELAVVTPLTSFHCERVFRRMKRVVSPARSRMVQLRKENVVLLQVENRLLRWLAEQSFFKDNVVTRFQRYNLRRLERFSKK